MIVSALLVSSIKSLGETITDLTTAGAQPGGVYCYDKNELKRIADYAKNCEELKLDYDSVSETYNQLLQQSGPSPVIGSKYVFFGAIGAALLTGYVAAMKAR